MNESTIVFAYAIFLNCYSIIKAFANYEIYIPTFLLKCLDIVCSTLKINVTVVFQAQWFSHAYVSIK